MTLRPRPAPWNRGDVIAAVRSRRIAISRVHVSSVAGLCCPLRGRTPSREIFPPAPIVASVYPKWFRNGTSVQVGMEMFSLQREIRYVSRVMLMIIVVSSFFFFFFSFVILEYLGKFVYRDDVEGTRFFHVAEFYIEQFVSISSREICWSSERNLWTFTKVLLMN